MTLDNSKVYDVVADIYYRDTNPEAIEKFPPVLYKYRDWQNSFYKKAITDFELFAPNANSLNDPFDSNIELRFKSFLPSKKVMEEVVLETINEAVPFFSKKEKKRLMDEMLIEKNLKNFFAQNEKKKSVRSLGIYK